ncbi:MAG: hypothetical protein RIC15_04780 [Vicingaceae bacterium]
MKLLGYLLLRMVIAIFWFIPFPIIYFLSDFLTLLLYYVLPYRKKLIISNLKSAFPQKSDKEIKQICFKFYRNLSDILLESLKGFTLSKNALIKRYEIAKDEKLQEYFMRGTSVIATTAHLTNWEWGAMALDLQVSHQITGVYKRLHHPYIDKYMIKNRGRYGTGLVEMKSVVNLMENISVESPFALVLIADQRPSDPTKAFWTHFLNRETAFFYGVEKFALEHRLPVLFFEIQRKKRGHYFVQIRWLVTDTDHLKKGDVIGAYRDQLEKIVSERPEDWLWSHSRWKHPRPHEMPIQD